MDLLSFVGNVASIIGLLIAFYTLYKVENLPSALKQQSRDRQLSEIIDKLTKVPNSKPILTESTVREVQALINTIRLFDVSKIPLVQSKRKTLLRQLEEELRQGKQLSVVLLQLKTIQTEITVR